MKKYITDREEPTFDIRNVFPDVYDEIQIIGDLTQIMNEKQFNYLKDKQIVGEIGYDDQTSYIKLNHLFTLEDIKNKIEEICKGVK